MQNNYLDMLGKLKFDSGVGEKQKVSSGDPNIVVTYTTRFADKNPEYSIKLRFMFDMQRGDPNPVIRNWHQFKSEKDGNFMSIDCPAARCPICNGTFTVWIYMPPVIFPLRVDLGITVDLTGGCQQKAGVIGTGNTQCIMRAECSGFHGLNRQIGVSVR